MSAHLSIRWRNAWIVPAALGTAVIACLCCDAWEYGPRPLPPGRHYAWWQSELQPGRTGTLVVTLVLGAVAVAAYWRPRRRDGIPIGLIALATMVLTAAILGLASYLPCQGQLSTVNVLFWVLQLYVGQPPSAVYQSLAPAAACHGQAPLALQLGQFTGLAATLFAGAAALTVLWRQPLDRLRSRFARKVTVFTGLDDLTLPVLARLADPGARRNVIVIEPDETHPLLDEARATGARVIIGPPAARSVLRPILVTVSGCTLDRIYALNRDTAVNDDVLRTSLEILEEFDLSLDNHPHLVARVDDPRQAMHWRGLYGARRVAFEDALSPAETTAYSLLDQILKPPEPPEEPIRRLIVCGDGNVTLAILLELDRQHWERQEQIAATEIGRLAAKKAADGREAPRPLAPLPVERVLLIDPEAAEIRREFLASIPRAIPEGMITARPARWEDALLPMLDEILAEEAAVTGVIVADNLSEENRNRAGRIARLHRDTRIYIQSESGRPPREVLFDRLRLYQRSLLVAEELPEDTWMRVARHWHECYWRQDPVLPGDRRAPARRPWEELSEFFREGNLLQVRSILAEVAALKRQWVPAHTVARRCDVELNGEDLATVAEREHDRWLARQLAAQRDGTVPASPDPLDDWSKLSAPDRERRTKSVEKQIAQLEKVGFVPYRRATDGDAGSVAGDAPGRTG